MVIEIPIDKPKRLPLRVLLVEDSEEDALLILHTLKTAGFELIHHRVETEQDMVAALEKHEWDVVLADHSLPRFDAPRALEVLKKSDIDVPFIIVSGSIQETIAIEAMRLGAHDYLMKGNLARLVPAIERELREAEMRRQKKQVTESLEHHTYYDPLTDLPNRTLFSERLIKALAYAEQHHQMLAVMYVDLDRFKTIIDTLGLNAGDKIIRAVADRLQKCLEEGDTLARLGGDEFVVLIQHIDRVDRAANIAHRILEAIQPVFTYEGTELHITTSIGISLYPYDGEDADTLLKNADTALYRAKEQGRNNYQLYTPAMNARAFERLALENSLRRAIERNEFVLYYQPQVDSKTLRIVGMEALVRWQHPDLGLVFPSEFIPIAEETGLIVSMGEWVLRTACAQAKAWQNKGYGPLEVAVNLSARQFQHQDLQQIISSALRDTGLEPHLLELELTESLLMQNSDFTSLILRDLKRMGVRISLDDFGTGYSSLSYLKKFSIDQLKIDQSFVRDLMNDSNDAAIANAIIVLAHSLKLKVVAEGVESQAQCAFLQERGCDRLQGFLFGKPVSAEAFEQFLKPSGPSSFSVI